MPSQSDLLHVIKATFNPGANSGERTIAAHPLGAFIPDNAIIVGGFIDVIETLTSNSANDAATIAIHVQGADDIVAAISIATGTIWDAGLRGVLPGNFALDGNSMTAIVMAAAEVASFVKTSAAKQITATIAVEALDTSAGKLNIFLYYYISE